MNPIVQFLTALGQVFAAISLYNPDHPMRRSAHDRLRASLDAAIPAGEALRISFMDGAVVVGKRTLAELNGWEWSAKFSSVGVQRLEILTSPGDADIDAMLTEMRRLLAATGGAATAWSHGPIRLGPLGVAAKSDSTVVVDSVLDALEFSGLGAELDAIGYLHSEVANGHDVPMAEVEAIVHGLALTIRREQDLLLPLFDLRNYDEYTITHSCNVSMLAIGLSEALGLSEVDARAIGTAALLHDIGKMRLPPELLTKPGALTDAERRLIQSHPAEGARILSQRGPGNGLAATVAYEHHIWFNGQGGYPALEFARQPHYASRIVHVCDIYDALCSRRPYRDAWPRDKALALIESVAGVELDPAITPAFVAMVRGATELRHTVADALV